LEAQGECRVFYCDGSGFSLTPVVPYAWQRGRRELTVPKDARKRLNVIGFWSRQGHFLSVEQTQGVDSDTIMQVFETLSNTLTLPTVLSSSGRRSSMNGSPSRHGRTGRPSGTSCNGFLMKLDPNTY